MISVTRFRTPRLLTMRPWAMCTSVCVCRVVRWECVRMMCTSVNTALTARREGSPSSNSGVIQSTAGPTVSTDFYRNFSPKELTLYVSSVRPWQHYFPLLYMSVWCRKCLFHLWLLIVTGWLTMMLLLLGHFTCVEGLQKCCCVFFFYFLDRLMIGGTSYVLPPVIFTNWPHSFKNANFQYIFAQSASAITPSEKVQLSLIGNLLHALQ